MNDLIELSDAELALVAAGGHGSPLAAGGHGSPLAGSSGHGLGLGRSVGAVQTNNSIIIEIAVALNINSPGAIAIASNGATVLQRNLVL